MNDDITNDEIEIEVEDTVEDEGSEEHVDTTEDDRDAEIEALRKQVKTLKIQKAKKAERAEQAVQEAPIAGDLSSKDLFALMNAKVEADDIDEVTDWAKHKNISVAEALKSNVVKSILEEKKNARKVASATNTGNVRRGTSEVSGDDLLANARANKMPESQADIEKLIEARMNRNNK